MPQLQDIPEIIPFHKMEASEAFSLAARESGLPFPVICKQMNWSKT